MWVPPRMSEALIVGAALVCVAGWPSAGATGNAPPRSVAKQPAHPASPCRLPDLVVASLTIELVSTTMGQPGVEFPTDRLKITGVIKDAGGMKSPAGFKVTLSKSGAHVIASRTIAAPATPGQVWSLVHDDTFLHDAPGGHGPGYLVKAEADFSECSKGNNQLAINLNDATLHAQGKQTAADPTITGPIQVPGSVVVVF